MQQFISPVDRRQRIARAIVTIGGQVPPRALIRLVMGHPAIYDAVNAIEGAPFESYASLPNVQRPASAEAAALRAAQIAVWRQTQWSAPYYWAAFVIRANGDE